MSTISTEHPRTIELEIPLENGRKLRLKAPLSDEDWERTVERLWDHSDELLSAEHFLNYFELPELEEAA